MMLLTDANELKHISARVSPSYHRAVADGPVGPAMAGPIIDPVILIFLIFFV